jgi:flagellar hook-associated protein 3 FlgL
MRVDPNPLSTIASALEQNEQTQNVLLQELSSGSSINAPSDNPVGAAQVLQDTFQKSADTQYGSNVANLQGQLQVASSTLSSVATTLTQAISLGTEGANGTMSATDRQSIANQVSGIQSQLMGLANTQYQGNYLFGGTASTTPPYSADSSGVVTYNGNNGVNTAEISSGQFTPTNIPGSKLFAGSGTDMFKAMNDLVTALQSGTGIPAATTEVQNAFNSVNTQTTFYGNTLSRLNSTAQFLTSEETQLTSNVTSVSGANMAQVASELDQTSVSAQALTGAAYQVNQLGLITILTG